MPYNEQWLDGVDSREDVDYKVDYLDTPFQRKLRELDACHEAREWVWTKTPQEAWEILTAPDPKWGRYCDWLTWLVSKLGMAECNCPPGDNLETCPQWMLECGVGNEGIQYIIRTVTFEDLMRRLGIREPEPVTITVIQVPIDEAL